MIETKQCSRCGEDKPLQDFYPQRSGTSAQCRKCHYRLYGASNAISHARYKAKNFGQIAERNRLAEFKYRGILHACDGTVTDEIVIAVYSQENCTYCKMYVPPDKRTMDHKIPIIRGGLHSANNVTMACNPCNSRKRNMTSEEYVTCLAEMKKAGFL